MAARPSSSISRTRRPDRRSPRGPPSLLVADIQLRFGLAEGGVTEERQEAALQLAGRCHVPLAALVEKGHHTIPLRPRPGSFIDGSHRSPPW